MRMLRCLLAVIFLSNCLLAQSATTRNSITTGDSIQGKTLPTTPATPLVAPVFLEDARFTSTLGMVNSVARSVHVDISLSDLQGQEVAHQGFDLAGNASKAVQIRDLLAAANRPISVGSIIVRPDKEAAEGRLIRSQLSITANPSGFPAYLEEELVIPGGTNAAVFHGSALNVKGSPILALRSLTDKPQTVTIDCYQEHPAGSSSLSNVIHLAPGELRLAAACSNQEGGEELIPEQITSDLGTNRGAVGISVSSTARSEELAVYGFVIYHDRRGVFFSSLDLADPASWNSATTVFAGVPVGRTPSFPGTSFHSQVAVSNFGPEASDVRVVVSKTGATGTPDLVTKDIARFSLPPQSSRTVDIPVQDGLPMTNSVLVLSNAQPGQVTARFVSWGDSLVRLLELQGKDSENTENGGEHPWNIKDGSDATMFVFNHTEKPKRIAAAIASEGTIWQEAYILAPKETKAINVSEIVRNHIPDHRGNVIPPGANAGTESWAGSLNGPATGRMLISRPEVGLARNFACGSCAHMCKGFNMAYLDTYGSLTGNMNTDWPLGYATVYECTGCTTMCGGTKDGKLDTFDSFDYSWTNNSVVSTSSGDMSLAMYSVNGAGVDSILYTAGIMTRILHVKRKGVRRLQANL